MAQIPSRRPPPPPPDLRIFAGDAGDAGAPAGPAGAPAPPVQLGGLTIALEHNGEVLEIGFVDRGDGTSLAAAEPYCRVRGSGRAVNLTVSYRGPRRP